MPHGVQVALPLQHASELGEIGLEPVLFLIAFRRSPEVADHGVDVVFQLGDFAAGFHLNGTSQVALGDGGGDFGDART